MPGGRLTQQDRQRITAALADGLGYAEIARQLGRPTSTISREVARNGGPDGYRAEHAHQATERRARRRPRSTPPAPAVPVGGYGRDPAQVLQFVEQFATLMVQTGMPRMAARVFARLVTTDSGRLTAAELVDQLQVSPASVSKAIAYLEPMELVRRERDPRRSRDVYVIDDDVWLRTWLTSARTNAMWAEAAQRGVDVFDAATPAGARLHQMSGFFSQLSDDMAGGPSVLEDMVTVLAGLLHALGAAGPGTALGGDGPATAPGVHGLATALGWPAERLAAAVRDAGPDRLTAEQREAVAKFVLVSGGRGAPSRTA